MFLLGRLYCSTLAAGCSGDSPNILLAQVTFTTSPQEHCRWGDPLCSPGWRQSGAASSEGGLKGAGRSAVPLGPGVGGSGLNRPRRVRVRRLPSAASAANRDGSQRPRAAAVPLAESFIVIYKLDRL